MKLYLHNTLSKKKELFIPINDKRVSLYVCGPTVYNSIHIGNARSLVVYDVLYRLLQHIYGIQKVYYVRNITDVDDKINDRAKELDITIFELTKKTIADFHKDAYYLNCLAPSVEPKATDHIDQMIQMIKILMQKGSAYVKDDGIYFNVKTFEDYMSLSGRKVENAKVGTRIALSEKKINIEDWVLWKKNKSQEQIKSFSSPWGNGHPGWHIECSAMACHYLGADFDIHGGGIDLIFPHHTNEIAQSRSAFPGSSFARYWMHNGFLTVEGRKMSKSLNNFITVQDIAKKGIASDVLRYTLLNSHYRKPLNFTKKLIEEAVKNLALLRRVTEGLEGCYHNDIGKKFFEYLLDDLNTREALQYIVSLAKTASLSHDIKFGQNIKYCANFMGFLQKDIEIKIDDREISRLVKARLAARQAKDWALVDQIRNDLKAKGVFLQDLKDGSTTWYKE